MEDIDFLIRFLIPALLITITVHEAAHAWVANYFGDPTAKHAGRLTLNPLKHLDPLGTIALFLVHFGWGKPVPVNPYNLRNPKKDQAFIALAGPMSNFVTAALLMIPLKYFVIPTMGMTSYVSGLLQAIILLNLTLMVFNLIPIPPLDGSKVLFALLPERFDRFISEWEQKGPVVLIALIVIERITDVPIFSYILGWSHDIFWVLLEGST